MVEQVHEKRPPDVLAEDICYKMIVPAQAVRYKATDTADWTHARWPFECTFVLRDTGHGITLEVRNHMRQSLFKSFRPVGMQLTSLTQQDLLHANETWYVVHALHLAIPRSWLCRLLVGQSIAHDKGLANHRARLTPESGRPRYTENDWAYQQVHELGRKPDDVYREWLKRAGERVDTLVNPRDSFQKAIKPKK